MGSHTKPYRRSVSTLLALLFCSTFFVSPAWGSLITYNLVDLGGSQYRYDYTVTNDGSLPGSAAIELFDIAFDPALYDESSLNIVSASGLAPDWDQNILASYPGVPAMFDVFALGSGIASGNTIAGFAVEFLWLGGGSGPGAQAYEILDANTFDVIASGITVESANTSVPIPPVIGLMCLGIWMARLRTQ